MDVLVAGEFVEFLDARLHVVAGDPLPRHDGGEVDLVLHPLVGGDRLGGNVEPEIALGLHHGDPEFAFQHDPPLGGPDGLHGGRGVAFGEDVGNHAASLARRFEVSRATLPTRRGCGVWVIFIYQRPTAKIIQLQTHPIAYPGNPRAHPMSTSSRSVLAAIPTPPPPRLMHSHPSTPAALASTVLLCLGPLIPQPLMAESPAYSWHQTATTLALRNGEKTVWQLVFDPQQPKTYFHPLATLEGEVLTAFEPPDHRWHRGLWWSWKFINGV